MKIEIIQYIESGKISVLDEIRKIESNGDIDVVVNEYFILSPDFEPLNKEIGKLEETLRSQEAPTEIHKDKLRKLTDLRVKLQVDVLNLAHLISNTSLKTIALKDAVQLFNEGRITQANTILDEYIISKNQAELILKADYLEWKLNSNWSGLARAIQEL